MYFSFGKFLQFPKCGNGSLCFEYIVEGSLNKSIGSDGCVAGAFCEMIASELDC